MKQAALYRLEQSQIEQLREIKQRTGTPEAEIVRQALDTYLPFLAEDGLQTEILAAAAATYEDAITNPQRIHRLAAGWYYDRQDNSKRGALKRLETEVAQLSERMTALEQMVREIYNRGNHDTDHG